jgi:hypothetical protein
MFPTRESDSRDTQQAFFDNPIAWSASEKRGSTAHAGEHSSGRTPLWVGYSLSSRVFITLDQGPWPLVMSALQHASRLGVIRCRGL